jgi:hypothetical protein
MMRGHKAVAAEFTVWFPTADRAVILRRQARSLRSITEYRNVSQEGIMAEFISELWAFLRENKKLWLLPIILVLGLFGGLIVLTQGSAISPFLYAFF